MQPVQNDRRGAFGPVRIYANRDNRALGPRVVHEFLDARLVSAEAANFARCHQQHEALEAAEAIVSDAGDLAGKADAPLVVGVEVS